MSYTRREMKDRHRKTHRSAALAVDRGDMPVMQLRVMELRHSVEAFIAALREAF